MSVGILRRLRSALITIATLAVSVAAVFVEAKEVAAFARLGGAWLLLGFVFAVMLVSTALLGAVRVGTGIAWQLRATLDSEPEPHPAVQDMEPDVHAIERLRETQQLKRGF
jgi:hypothetical protein